MSVTLITDIAYQNDAHTTGLAWKVAFIVGIVIIVFDVVQ